MLTQIVNVSFLNQSSLGSFIGANKILMIYMAFKIKNPYINLKETKLFSNKVNKCTIEVTIVLVFLECIMLCYNL